MDKCSRLRGDAPGQRRTIQHRPQRPANAVALFHRARFSVFFAVACRGRLRPEPLMRRQRDDVRVGMVRAIGIVGRTLRRPGTFEFPGNRDSIRELEKPAHPQRAYESIAPAFFAIARRRGWTLSGNRSEYSVRIRRIGPRADSGGNDSRRFFSLQLSKSGPHHYARAMRIRECELCGNP